MKNMKKHKQPKARNPYAADPLMRRGGVHQKSRGAQRQELKRELKRSLNNED